VVELEHIGKRYGAATVLADVSLRVEEGEFCVLTGASGAGKTTLLNIIALIEAASAGRLHLFGVDVARLDRDARARLRRRIGIIFQDGRLIDEWTVRDNIALPQRVAALPERDIAANVGELLTWIGLAEHADTRAAALSAGERQLVAIARALITRPELLLADEPAGSAGDDISGLMVRAFEQLNRVGTTILVASADAGFARAAHRRLSLDGGRLAVADAAPAR